MAVIGRGDLPANLCQHLLPNFSSEGTTEEKVVAGLGLTVTQPAVLASVKPVTASPVCCPVPPTERQPNEDLDPKRHPGLPQ